jgi:hypothetical protein
MKSNLVPATDSVAPAPASMKPEHRVGGGSSVQGAENDDLKADFSARPGGAIFEDLIRAAARFPLDVR